MLALRLYIALFFLFACGSIDFYGPAVQGVWGARASMSILRSIDFASPFFPIRLWILLILMDFLKLSFKCIMIVYQIVPVNKY